MKASWGGSLQLALEEKTMKVFFFNKPKERLALL